ncbi:MAG: imidazolonepropionase [Ilumatobacteraceae bacterium]|nr:imidazolonepropionase [Ilumatobacteraceae bacterium]
MSRPSMVIDNIGLLITNDAQFEVGATGQLRDAWVVLIDGLIEAVGTGQAPIADRRIDAAGRCVMPGFVDSHSHLVFAGDRSDEFAARMAGRAYEAGGIRTTVAATRAATDDELLTHATSLVAEASRSGTTTIEIKSGYGLTAGHEARVLRVAHQLTDETTFLGAHVVPPEFDGRVDDYVSLVCGEMLTECAPLSRWVDAFCERGAFDADQCRAVLQAGREAGLGLRLHANQLGNGPGVQLAVELACASADHCTYLSDDDVAALAASDTVATFLPATDFSTRQPYPDARRLLDAGGTVALASNCNPGSSYTTSMPFCIALAVRDMNMTIDEAIWAATAGGATALRRVDIGIVATGARADLIILDTVNPIEFVYRPGVPAIAATIIDGQTFWPAVDA